MVILSTIPMITIEGSFAGNSLSGYNTINPTHQTVGRRRNHKYTIRLPFIKYVCATTTYTFGVICVHI
jgi:hypothetical protein